MVKREIEIVRKKKNGDGSTQTTRTGYQTGHGFHHSKTTESNNNNNTSPNVGKTAVGVAALIVAGVSAVSAGVNVVKQIAKGRASNKVADLDDSVRNSAQYIEDDDEL